MRLPRFRVRTLMIAVGVVALLIWGAMMASQSYDWPRPPENGSSPPARRITVAIIDGDDSDLPRSAIECHPFYGELCRLASELGAQGRARHPDYNSGNLGLRIDYANLKSAVRSICFANTLRQNPLAHPLKSPALNQQSRPLHLGNPSVK